MGDGKLIRSIKIIAIDMTIITNIILINIPKIPFELPILVFFQIAYTVKYFQNKTYLWFFNKEL